MQHFSPWQISRLRTRLVAYRLNTSRDGEPKPWLDIAQEILDSDSTALYLHEADEDPMTEHEPLASDNRKPDKDWPITGESLRKFSKAETILKRDRLQAVCDFLLDVGYLSRQDLKSPQIHYAAYDLMAYFLGEDARPMPTIEDSYAEFLTGQFQSCVVSDRNITESELCIDLSGDKAALLISETTTLYRNPGKPAYSSWRDQERKLFSEVRKVLSGWGIFLALRGLIVFFMKNDDDGLEPQIYSASVVKPRGERGNSALAFIRMPLTRIPASYIQVAEEDYKVALNLQDLGKDVFLFERLNGRSNPPGNRRATQADDDPAERPRSTIVPLRAAGQARRDG